MNSSKLSDWLQIAANVGIIAGLLLVGLQLKQNSDLLKTQLLYEESSRLVDLETQVIGEIGAEVWAKSISDPGKLSLSEQRIMEALLWSFVEQLRATRLLAELGLTWALFNVHTRIIALHFCKSCNPEGRHRMEKADHELIEKIVPVNSQLRELYNRHVKLEKEVERFGRYAAYSSSAALRQKELKKQKLLEMDRIMSILNEHKIEANA